MLLVRKIISLFMRIELLEMDTKKSPLEKLQCIVRCCNSIFGIFNYLLKSSIHGKMIILNFACSEALKSLSSLGADHFVPSLIYTVIISRPPKLQSNIKYDDNFYFICGV